MEVECLGACDRAPLVMVNDSWHECLAPEDARESSLTTCAPVVKRRSRVVIIRDRIKGK